MEAPRQFGLFLKEASMITHPVVVLTSFLVLVLSVAKSQAVIISGPIFNPSNSSTYYLLAHVPAANIPNPFDAAQAEALTLGGTLATINDAAEDAWVFSTFDAIANAAAPLSNRKSLLIGLTDRAVEGTFSWISGEPLSYSNWSPGQPQAGTVGEDYVGMALSSNAFIPLDGRWHDIDFALGDVVYAVVETTPKPLLVNARPYHNAFPDHSVETPNGPDGQHKVDTSVNVIQRGASQVAAQLNNIISSSQGISGVVLDFDELTDLNDITLEFKMSPQNVFATPVESWSDVPAAPTATLLPNAGHAGSDRIQLIWGNGTITDRYLCIRVIHYGDTIAELYLGHLRGEMTGASGGKFTILVADILAVRTDLSLAQPTTGRTDVDKSGTVLVQDILDTRSNLSKELTQVTIPAIP